MPDPHKTSKPTAQARGIAWIDGRLFLRIASRWPDELVPGRASPTIILRDILEWKTLVIDTRVISQGKSGGVVQFHLESWFDPRTADDGAWISGGVWQAAVRVEASGRAPKATIRTKLGDSAAMVAGEQMVAFRGRRRALLLDVGARSRSVLDDARLRTDRATISANSTHSMSVSVPIDGVRVHGRGIVEGAITAVRDGGSVWQRALYRFTGRPYRGAAQLVAAGDELTLEARISLPRGRWRVSPSFGPASKPVMMSLDLTDVAEARIAPAASSRRSPAPRVSVIATGRAGSSLIEAVRAAIDQTLPVRDFEVLAVPSAGNEESALQTMAETTPALRVITPPPATNRAGNTGLARAQGVYVLFIDADDRLNPRALEKLVEMADATNADVVAGRVLAVTHRVKTPKAYEVTTPDADLVAHQLLESATPNHLMRRSRLDSQGLRPDDDIEAGGWLLGVRALLVARRIATLADEVYCLRAGPGCTTTGGQTNAGPDDDVQAALRLADAIVDCVPAGTRRNALLCHAANRLADAARHAALVDAHNGGRVISDARRRAANWWMDPVRALQSERQRMVLDVLMYGDDHAFCRFAEETQTDPQSVHAEVTESGILLNAPGLAEADLPAEHRQLSFRAVRHMMTSLTVQRGVALVTGWIAGPDSLGTPEEVRVALRLRGSDELVKLPVEMRGPVVSEQPPVATPMTFHIDPDALVRPGRWDLEVAPVWMGHALPATRFGSQATTSVDEASVDRSAVALGSPTAVLYGTATHGNLSVALNDGMEAVSLSVVRLQLDQDGRPEVVVSLPGSDARLKIHSDVDPPGPREASHRLPWRSLDKEHVAARLPVPRTGSLYCILSAVYRGIRSEVRLAEDLAPVSSAAVDVYRRDGRLVVTRTVGL